MKNLTFNFDLDGTLADLYSRPTWLQELRAFDPTPYEVARVMVNMRLLARYLNRAQAKGCKINIISWLSKETTPQYDKEVTQAKLRWLRKHLPSVKFDNIYIVPYGTPKSNFAEKGGFNILFDDEAGNRKEWERLEHSYAYPPNCILGFLQKF